MIARLCGVAEEETRRVVLMFGAVFFLIAAHTTTKVVRDSLFLSHFGLTELSYTMMALAVLAGVAVSLYSRFTSGIARHRVIWGLHLVVAGSLIAVTVALRLPHRLLPVIFYLWSGLFGLVILTEFWLLANDLFHAREAKRLFAVIGAGGVLGGILGGMSSSWLARPIGTRNLLVVVAIELIVAAALSHGAWIAGGKSAAPEVAPRSGFTDELKLLGKSRYARLIALLTICMTVALTLAEWQYKGFAKAHYTTRQDDMAHFFGIIAGLVGAFAFLLQLLGTSKLIKRIGAPGALRALPTVCGVGALMVLGTWLLPLPAIFVAAGAMMLIDGVHFTVDKAAAELLYVPLEVELRSATKRFVETVVDRFAGALSALVWLFLTWSVHINRVDRLPYVSFITLGAVVAWLVVIARVRPAYLDAFRAVIGADAAPATVEEVQPINQRVKAQIVARLAQLEVSARNRTRILRSLAPLQRAQPTLGFAWSDIERHVQKEVQMVSTLQQAFELTNLGAKRTTLRRLIEDRLGRAIERVARLLSLVYPPQDIVAVHRALRGESVRARAGALELLESMIEGESKVELLQVLEIQTLGGRPLPEISRADGLRLLFTVEDSWLRACAAWAAADCGALCAELEQLSTKDPSLRVRAAAVLSLRSARRRTPRPSELLVAVEKTDVDHV